MDTLITFITSNKEWLFSGIGVVIVVGLLKNFTNNKKRSNPELAQQNNITNTININNTEKSSITQDEPSSFSKSKNPKDIIHILFIDDEKFNMVNILKKAGWNNTTSVKDISGLDDSNVIRADIIFVDINGVGKNLFQSQGIGLASALKDKYSQKKIIIYSAETNGDRFDKALKKVDECLSKNAEPYEFISLVENFAAEIYG